MSIEEIAGIVQVQTGLTHEGMKHNRPVNALFARYVAIVMMDEEGIEKPEIAKFFGMDRTNVYYTLKTTATLLVTNKPFKTLYLACIKRMAEMEGEAA